MLKIDSNRTHYLKWKLDLADGHYSIRYHFLWQDKKDHENKYVLKHHATGASSLIDEKMARTMIRLHGKTEEEIIASVQMMNSGSDVGRVHKKVVIGERKIKSYHGGKEDVMLNKMSHKFYE